MTLRPLFEWVDTLESSITLRESINAYPLLLTAHVVSMGLFAGLMAFWDFRLVGAAIRPTLVSEMPKRIFPWALTGFAINFITGGLLVYSQPMRYYVSFYFWLKLAMMALAGLNMMVFHVTVYRRVDRWDSDALTPPAARFAGVASLVLWAGVIVTGRMIAYSGLAPDWWDALKIGQ